MKKLVTLALAGICALAFTSVVDAASAIRIRSGKGPTEIRQGNNTVVGSVRVQVNSVSTGYSQYAVNDGTYASQGGYFNAYSIWVDGLLNSQSVYDDVKEALGKVGSQFANLFPAVATEATYVHVAQISSGNSAYNKTITNASSAYQNVSNIAYSVIPGRVASLAAGTSEIDMSAENTAANNPNVPQFDSPEAADAWVNKVKADFNAQEAANANAVQNYINNTLLPQYNAVMDELAAAEAAVEQAQANLNGAIDTRDSAQNAYDAAKQAKQNSYNSWNSQSNLSNLEDAYDAAKQASATAKADKEAKEAVAAQAQADYNAAVKALNNFDYDAEATALEEAREEAIANAESDEDVQAANDAYASGIAELNAQLSGLERAVTNANTALGTANSNATAAGNAYTSAVTAENTAKTTLEKAQNSRESARQKYQRAQETENQAKAALDTAKSNVTSAQNALSQAQQRLSQAQAAVNPTLANLKTLLTSFINSLKYIDDQTGKLTESYNVSHIPGYDSIRFDNVKYSYNSFTTPEYSISSSNQRSGKSLISTVNVSFRDTPVIIRDGQVEQIRYIDKDTYESDIYYQTGRKYISPLVLDIAGNGQLQASNGQHMPNHDVVKTNNIVADFFGDGFEIAMEWVGPQDGLLVAPKADGSVDMSCLFGTAGGYENGYEKLSLYDKNNDMRVTADELNGLSIWQDANSNGIAEANEVKTVKSLGITAINLDFNKQNFISSFERNGQTYKMWDWWPNAVELIKVAAK